MSETTILTHADSDGICAGAIALSRFPGSRVFFTRPTSFYQDLMDTDSRRIVVSDIALTKQDAARIVKLFRKRKEEGSEILYFDHHIIPPAVTRQELSKSLSIYVHSGKASASELIYRHYMNEIPRERVWLAIYGAIGDYSDDTPFVKERIRNWDRRALFFEVSTICLGIKEYEFADYDGKRRMVRILARGDNPSDIPGLVRSARKAVNREFDLYEIIKEKAQVEGKVAYVKDVPTFGFRGPSALFAATVRNTRFGVSAHTRERYVDITMRTRDYSLKLNVLADKAAEAVGGSGGGHAAAAGAKIPKGSFSKFLNSLNRQLK
ncbi:MAG: DHH family phosphoesterase [Candidatus Aenigmarchaeota archaeon]|nr:DHH family phosphoesterase [Candidatus Aenigmarchaeota archaeon]